MCLTKDEEELLTFYDFPAAYFQHIRTTNPIESSFSTEKNACDDVQVITAGGKRMAPTARIQRDSVRTGREAIP